MIRAAVAQPLHRLARPRIARAEDSGRIDADHRRTRRLERTRKVLALRLGAPVCRRHTSDGIVAGDHRPARRKQGRDARHVEDGIEAELVRRTENIARTVGIRRQAAAVRPDLGRAVEHRVAASQRFGDGGAVQHVALDHVGVRDAAGSEHPRHLLAAAREQPHLVPGAE
jgi:hypothetical protein